MFEINDNELDLTYFYTWSTSFSQTTYILHNKRAFEMADNNHFYVYSHYFYVYILIQS